MPTKIQWTSETWNPIRARNRATNKVGWHCTLKSPGCTNCYAQAINQKAFHGLGTGLPYTASSTDQVEIFLDENTLQKPLRWRKPKMIFVESMSDLFGKWMTDDWLDLVFAVAALCPQHTFQVLTKRPERMREYLTTPGLHNRLELAADTLQPGKGHPSFAGKHMLPDLPLGNVWAGFSAENQEWFDCRWESMKPLAEAGWLVWCSAEPLLGHIQIPVTCDFCCNRDRHCDDSSHHYRPDCPVCQGTGRPLLRWLVVGGESGPGARPCDIAHIRALVRQCKTAGVSAFVKQLGNRPYIGDTRGDVYDDHTYFKVHHPKGGDIAEFPSDLQVREFPEVTTHV